MSLRKPKLANFKPVRKKDPAYLKKIRQLPCCVCGKQPPSEAHHLKSTGERGMALRSSDRWAVPLCREHHGNGVERVGSKREVEYFMNFYVQPLRLAELLYEARDSFDEMKRVLINQRMKHRTYGD